MTVVSKHIDKVSIFGLGYIGLPTAAILTQNKIPVIGVDVNKSVVDLLNTGKIHIVEPNLETIIRKSVANGLLRAVCIPEQAEIFIIAVPTPFVNSVDSDYVPDLSYVEAACQAMAPVLRKGNLIILESTSPVGTTELIDKWLSIIRPDLRFPIAYGDDSDVRIAYCPERILPGNALFELVENDRVIGGLTAKCSLLAKKFYKQFVQGRCVITNSRTAEMCKLTENSFRDVNLAFANELSLLAHKFDINVRELINIANLHPRVNILQPGAGVGGHCIAVDPWFIVNAAPTEAKLIRSAREVNDAKPLWVLSRLKAAIEKYSTEKNIKRREISIAIFGLVFKPDIDDIRESPSLLIVEKLIEEHKGTIYIVEPNIKVLPKKLHGKVLLTSIENGINSSDISIFLVAHKEFKIASNLLNNHPLHLDICGILEA